MIQTDTLTTKWFAPNGVKVYIIHNREGDIIGYYEVGRNRTIREMWNIV